MKRILYTTLVALLATLTPAFAADPTKGDGAQIIELQLTKYGSLQNAAGTAKITFGDTKPGETFGLVMTATTPDDKEYVVAIVTKKGGVYKAASFVTYLGSGSVKMFLEELPGEITSVKDIAGVSILDDSGIVLEGAFPSIQPQS